MDREVKMCVKYFSCSPNSPMYSQDWECVELLMDQDKRELVARCKSRINSCYDKEVRMQL